MAESDRWSWRWRTQIRQKRVVARGTDFRFAGFELSLGVIRFIWPFFPRVDFSNHRSNTGRAVPGWMEPVWGVGSWKTRGSLDPTMEKKEAEDRLNHLRKQSSLQKRNPRVSLLNRGRLAFIYIMSKRNSRKWDTLKGGMHLSGSYDNWISEYRICVTIVVNF